MVLPEPSANPSGRFMKYSVTAGLAVSVVRVTFLEPTVTVFVDHLSATPAIFA